MGKVYLVKSRFTGSSFALKRAKGLKETDRRNFLAELQVWIDLPEHPNLVPCRFFRSVGLEILIFADYVKEGSLKEWIASRRLYQGSPREALERMLDIAIQFAWGLHCLHEMGLVHQDVKPANVLMSGEGKPQVTDYGLARGRAAAGEARSAGAGQSILVSSGGGTPAYWSPEQAGGQPITRTTDTWSWGVSVLEMFTGEVTWMSGLGAPAVLEQLLREGAQADGIPQMPGGVAELLGQCFQTEPRARPGSLGEAVDRLEAVFRKSVGAKYDRALAFPRRHTATQAGIQERRGPAGAGWTDSKKWLEKALRAASRDPTEAALMLAARGASRQGALVAQLAGYDEAKRIYVQLVHEGRKELEIDLANLHQEKALVHTAAGDDQVRCRSMTRRLRSGSVWLTRRAMENWPRIWREFT